MQRVLVLAEGQTEERFIKSVLCPYLWDREIDLIPTIAVTKRIKSGPNFKGGITSYQKVENDLRRLLGDTNATAVTTLIDYYGLPADFPGMTSRPTGNAIQRVQHVEARWRAQIDNPRFSPFLLLHEFEALLFAQPNEIGTTLNTPDLNPYLTGIRTSFQSPEDINETPNGSPSQRIIAATRRYQKVLHGPTIASRIGLGSMRDQCPHFDRWLKWLESF